LLPRGREEPATAGQFFCIVPFVQPATQIAEESIPTGRVVRAGPGGGYLLRGLIWLLVAAVAWICFVEGLRLRRWVFDMTDSIHFADDIHRGCYWGLKASGPEGYLNQYEKMSIEQPDWKDPRWNIWLDYAPLRLLVMREWGAWLRVHHPPGTFVPLIDAWQPSWDYTAPALYFNTAMEAFTAILAFFLTRYWVVRAASNQPPWHFRGVWQGCVAALLIWFSPAMMISAYGWPTWDSWIVPWYLLAALLASTEWWFCAGLAIAVGAMFKGQQLTVAAIFLVWPLVQGRIGPALRWLSGLIFGLAAIASPWLLSYLPPDRVEAARRVQSVLPVSLYPTELFAIVRKVDVSAIAWIAGLLIVVAVVPWILRVRFAGRFKWIWTLAAALIIVIYVYWPWLLPRNRSDCSIGLLVAACVAAGALCFRPRHQPYVLAAVAGTALLLCMAVFHGSSGWWDCSFHFGTIHWPYMVQGLTSNIPGLLERRYGWSHMADDVAFTLPAIQGHWPGFIVSRPWWPAVDLDITSKQLFNTIYAILLMISGIAIGLQARRNDRRMLVALTTPWVLFFVFPVQIHERYLLFAAGVSAICIGQSVGAALLGVFLSLVTSVMTLDVMMDHGDVGALGISLNKAFPWLFSESSGTTLQKYIHGTHPDIAWGVLVAAGVFFYLSLAPTSAGRRGNLDAPP
jgi:hypothetical protein